MKASPSPSAQQRAASCFTRRQAAGALCFALVFALLFSLADRLLFDERTLCTTWTRIREEKSVPEVLIMGNSHAFCSFVPDMLNGALGVDSAVLSATGQDAHGVTDTFAAVLQTGKPKLVILEMNAFLFESGLMATAHKGSALDNINAMPGLWQRVKTAWRELGLESVPQGAFQLLCADRMWSRWSGLFAPKVINRYDGADVLGYGALGWYAQGDYHSDDIPITGDPAATENSSVLDEAAQTELRRFLGMAQQNDVEVWLIKAPIASRWVVHPTCVDVGRAIAADFGDTVTFCYDFSDELPRFAFTSADFYDGGHLNRRGAAKFTTRFAQVMGQRLNRPPDLDKPFAYLDERVEPLPDGRYRYTVIASGENLRFHFELKTESGDLQLYQDWSESNAAEIDLPPEKADSLVVTLCPEGLMAEKERYALRISFMAPDSCILDR